ncbi:MAG: hypothetical protein M3P06_24245 [Acidobacteriota bacterium]|nr:hypothetical protein [Acidobacteriota bacterium]
MNNCIAVVGWILLTAPLAIHAEGNKAAPPPTQANTTASTEAAPIEVGVIQSQPPIIQDALAGIDNRLRHIEAKVEPPSMLRKIGEDFVSNFLWEAFNFRKGTTSRVAQVSAALGLVFTVLRIFFFLRERRKGLSIGQTLAEIGTVTYLVLITLVLGALVYSGGFLREEQSGASDFAGLRSELRDLRTSVDQLRTVPTTDVLARAASLSDQMMSLERHMKTRESIQLASVADAVANTRNHTAAFWLQVIELVGILITTVCVAILFYDKFMA